MPSLKKKGSVVGSKTKAKATRALKAFAAKQKGLKGRRLPASMFSTQVDRCLTLSVPLPRIAPTLAWLFQWSNAASKTSPDDTRKQSLHSYARAYHMRAFIPGELALTKADVLAYQLAKPGAKEKVRAVLEALIHEFKRVDDDPKHVQRFQRYTVATIVGYIEKVLNKEIEYTMRGYQVFHHAMTGVAYIINRILRYFERELLATASTRTEKSNVHRLAIDGLLPPCFVEAKLVKETTALERAKAEGLGERVVTQIPSRLADRMYEAGLYFKAEDMLSHTEPNDHSPLLRRRLTSVNYSLLGNFPNFGESTMTYLLMSKSVQNVTQFLHNIPLLTTEMKDLAEQMIFTAQMRYTSQLPGILMLFAIPCNQVERFVYDSYPYGIPTGRGILDALGSYLDLDKPWDFRLQNVRQGRIMDLCYGEQVIPRGVVREVVHFLTEDQVKVIDQLIKDTASEP